MKCIFWIGVGVLVIGGCGPASSTTSTSSSSSARRELQVTAGRGATGFAFTNRESSDITDCRVEIPDGATTWVSSTAGVIPLRVKPLETVRIGWGNFGASGQRMPEYIGANQNRFDISCTVDGSVLSVAVGYD